MAVGIFLVLVVVVVLFIYLTFRLTSFTNSKLLLLVIASGATPTLTYMVEGGLGGLLL